jgi:hypothetical protein
MPPRYLMPPSLTFVGVSWVPWKSKYFLLSSPSYVFSSPFLMYSYYSSSSSESWCVCEESLITSFRVRRLIHEDGASGVWSGGDERLAWPVGTGGARCRVEVSWKEKLLLIFKY